MAAAPQPEPLTIEQYMQTRYRPDCDFVDGYLEERNVGDPKHGALQMQIGHWFLSHPEWNLRAISELRTRVNSSRVRLPDVAVVADDDDLWEYPRTSPPMIAIEILSAEDRLNRVIPRLREFLAMGVRHVWLLDPVERAAYTCTDAGLNLIEGDRLNAESPVYLDLLQIFSALNDRLGRAR
jgi:Uma2 family endonuclease